MDDLITALQILRKYSEAEFPTGCDHDILRVYVNPSVVSDMDKTLLENLSFKPDEGCECFYSFRFGSA